MRTKTSASEIGMNSYNANTNVNKLTYDRCNYGANMLWRKIDRRTSNIRWGTHKVGCENNIDDGPNEETSSRSIAHSNVIEDSIHNIITEWYDVRS